MDARTIKGYAVGAVGAASYGLNPLFALPLMTAGMPTSSILIFRYLLAIPLLWAIARARRVPLRLSLSQHLYLLFFGIMVGLSSVFLFESYKYMDAGIASTLLFVYPLMVAFIMATFYHEKVTPITILSLAGALTGIGLLYKGEGGETLSALGTMFVMASSLSYAIYIVGVRKSRLSRLPAMTTTFYVIVYGILACFLTVLFEAEPGTQAVVAPSGPAQWGCVLGLALFPTAISFLATTRAITIIGSTPAAILGALEPLTAVVVGALVFGEVITFRIAVGFVLILGAVTLIIAAPMLTRRMSRMLPSRK